MIINYFWSLTINAGYEALTKNILRKIFNYIRKTKNKSTHKNSYYFLKSQGIIN